MSQQHNCIGCRWFKQQPVNPANIGAPRPGECRRLPPQPVIVGQTAPGQFQTVGLFPPVPPDGWCGEYESNYAVPVRVLPGESINVEKPDEGENRP